jgi:hypothetical protein
VSLYSNYGRALTFENLCQDSKIDTGAGLKSESPSIGAARTADGGGGISGGRGSGGGGVGGGGGVRGGGGGGGGRGKGEEGEEEAETRVTEEMSRRIALLCRRQWGRDTEDMHACVRRLSAMAVAHGS